MMIWSDHDEALRQLRRRRQRVLRRLMLVALAHALGAALFETYAGHHRALHVLTALAFAVSLAGLGSVAVLGARWAMNSNAAESWSASRHDHDRGPMPAPVSGRVTGRDHEMAEQRGRWRRAQGPF